MFNIHNLVAVATASALVAIAVPAVAATLDDDGLQREIIGNVLKGSMGPMTVRVLHRADGSSVMQGTMGSDEGRWSIQQGQLCVQWNTFGRGELSCATLEPLGDGRYRSSRRGIVLEIEN